MSSKRAAEVTKAWDAAEATRARRPWAKVEAERAAAETRRAAAETKRAAAEARRAAAEARQPEASHLKRARHAVMIAKGIGARGVSREGNQVNHFGEHRAEVYSETISSYLAHLQTLPAVNPAAQLLGLQLVQETIRVALRNAMPTPPPEAKQMQALH